MLSKSQYSALFKEKKKVKKHHAYVSRIFGPWFLDDDFDVDP